MTVFDILGISEGDSITTNNPWSDAGEREMIPLGLSKNGISIRAIDIRHGDIRYIGSDWLVKMNDGRLVTLKSIPYIAKKIAEWNALKNQQKESEKKTELHESAREIASFCEVICTLKLADSRVCITGKLPFPRSKIKEQLEDKGAIISESINKKVDFLIMGDTGKFEVTSKMKKAQDLGIRIVTVSK